MNNNTLSEKKPFVETILNWYAQNKRDLPWRSHSKNPYYIWLSEVMLQQTTVPTVLTYFDRFTKKWPTVKDLAIATQDEVLSQWAGLGYYARARNLHKCAQILYFDYGGEFPDNEKDLLALPGIGTYTAAAIAAIAFQKSAIVIDGNIERVLSRIACVIIPFPQAKKIIKPIAAALTPAKNAGDYAQSLMDLSAALCRPKNPKCSICPLQKFCLAYQKNLMNEIPYRIPKKEKPLKYAFIYWIEDKNCIFIRKRKEKGLLGGMLELPSSPWGLEKWSQKILKESAPCQAEWHIEEHIIKHSFTHFDIYLKIAKAKNFIDFKSEGYWQCKEKIYDLALPTMMKKVIDIYK